MCRYIESNSLSAPGQKTIFFARKIEKVEGGLTFQIIFTHEHDLTHHFQHTSDFPALVHVLSKIGTLSLKPRLEAIK